MSGKAKYSATTRRISVIGSPTYLDDRSVPEDAICLADHVVIENLGLVTVNCEAALTVTNARGEVRRCAARASWASSRVLSLATSSNTPAARRL